MRKLMLMIVLLSVTALVLSACGGSSSGGAAGAGDVARGKALYNKSTIGTKSAEGCVSCHRYSEKDGKADKAPYTAGTATRSEKRVAGMSATDYIKESITKPDAYIVEGFNKGDMYQKFGAELSAQEIADIVAYLLTEK